jgi:uridine phosphorylase
VSRYLRPTATIAAAALLPSDPALAMRLAQELTRSPRMSNHNHGLWGYSGHTVDGLELTVQSTGIGGPSAAAVITELAELGVRRAFRVGTAVALDPRAAETTIVVGEAICDDGASRAYGAGARIAANPALTGSLAAAAGVRPAPIASCDVELDPRSPHATRLHGTGAVAADLETAALLAAAGATGVELGCAVVACSPVAVGSETASGALLDLGRLCLGALARAEAAAQLG